MAEINVQRKSGSNAMWWIVAILAILVVGWMMFARNNDAGATETPRSSLTEQPASSVMASGQSIHLPLVA